MSKPIITTHNIETGEISEREMTDEEFADFQAQIEEQLKLKTELEAKEQQKAALLEKLGITQEEAKLLLG